MGMRSRWVLIGVALLFASCGGSGGGGGGVPEAFPELAHSAATDRLAEAVDVGAECLVTACHHCVENLVRAQEPAEREALDVIDIIDLVYEAAGLEA